MRYNFTKRANVRKQEQIFKVKTIDKIGKETKTVPLEKLH